MARSAALLLHRLGPDGREVLIAHMGGPFWARKDRGAWSIIKGQYTAPETPFEAAVREFAEETGSPPPDGDPLPLGEVVQGSGKRVTAWAIESDFDPSTIRSQTFTVEWPPRSGKMQEFPEIDRAEWFDTATAKEKLVRAQGAFVDRLCRRLAVPPEG
jgi:predicted NUDIX family NTP pyrophosphohydrolase